MATNRTTTVNNKDGKNKYALSFVNALREHDNIQNLLTQITELEKNTVHHWYLIGYAILFSDFTQKEFAEATGENANTLNQAKRIAEHADNNDAYFAKIERNAFSSLRNAYDNVPRKQVRKVETTKKRASFTAEQKKLMDSSFYKKLPKQERDAIREAFIKLNK